MVDANETPVVAIEMKNVGGGKKTSNVGNVGVVNERQNFASKLPKPGKSRKSKTRQFFNFFVSGTQSFQ